MNKLTRLRAYVEKLLKNEFRTQYLQELYLGLRDLFFSRHQFREIGDFIAHSDNRNQGPLPVSLSHLANYLLLFGYNLKQYDPLTVLPRDVVCNGLKGQMHWRTPEKIAEKMNIRVETLQSRFAQLIKKIDRLEKHVLFSRGADFTEKEFAIFKYLTEYLEMRTLFDADNVYNDFIHVLCSNKILAASEIPALEYLRPMLILFAASRMHMVTISNHGNDITLSASATFEEKISVNARARINSGDKSLVMPILETGLSVREFTTDFPIQAEWDFFFELTDEGQLRIL